jgi:hypothetical protein
MNTQSRNSTLLTIRAIADRTAKPTRNPSQAERGLILRCERAGVPVPPAGKTVSVADVDKAMTAAGLSTRDRLTIKSAMPQAGMPHR